MFTFKSKIFFFGSCVHFPAVFFLSLNLPYRAPKAPSTPPKEQPEHWLWDFQLLTGTMYRRRTRGKSTAKSSQKWAIHFWHCGYLAADIHLKCWKDFPWKLSKMQC